MSIYFQLLCIIISFVYGVFIGFISYINNRLIKTNNKILLFMLNILFNFNIILLYIIIIFKINKGIFHIYFGFLVLIGYFLSIKCIKKLKLK